MDYVPPMEGTAEASITEVPKDYSLDTDSRARTHSLLRCSVNLIGKTINTK